MSSEESFEEILSTMPKEGFSLVLESGEWIAKVEEDLETFYYYGETPREALLLLREKQSEK